MLCACEDKMVYVVQYTDATAADRSCRYYQIWGVMMCDWTKGWGWTMCWVLLAPLKSTFWQVVSTVEPKKKIGGILTYYRTVVWPTSPYY